MAAEMTLTSSTTSPSPSACWPPAPTASSPRYAVRPAEEEAGAPEAGGSAARPLAGRTIVVTRPAAQSAGLAEPLTAAGARVIAAPAIEIVPAPLTDELRAAIAGLDCYDVVIFTSANGVEIFFDRCSECGAAPPTGAHPEVVAIGPATAAALEERGVATSLVPDEYVAEGVLAAVEARIARLADKRVLIPRAREARAVLPDTLRERGARVDVVTVYETRGARELPVPAAAIEAADYITFTSSSTVKHFVALLGEAGLAERLAGVRLASIGPVTSETLRSFGLAPAVEAAAYTASGLAAAIVAHAAAISAGGSGAAV
jgi:uroporphyrinogen III methyltransferase/synthase